MADPSELPWVYPYRSDQSTRFDREVMRPFVPLSMAAGDQTTSVLSGLVDTGADPILASDLLAVQLGIDLDNNEGETTHAVGGGTVVARYRTVELRLHSPDPESDEFLAWDAPIGFVAGHNYRFVLLGSVGFLDQWTVTASRFAQAVGIERRDTFDQRFGPTLA